MYNFLRHAEHRPCDFFASVALDSFDGIHADALRWLRESKIEDIPHSNGVRFGGRQIRWVDRVPPLKTWAGTSTLRTIMRGRQKLLPAACDDLFGFCARINGASGLDADAAQDPIDIGFSPSALGMLVSTRVAVEMLAVLGADMVPLIVWPDKSVGYECDGRRWQFHAEKRAGSYHSRWTHAREITRPLDFSRGSDWLAAADQPEEVED